MSKVLELLKRTQALAKQVNLRLAIVAIVLGVGGFAVYKGIQQMKPAEPAHKKVAKNDGANTPGNGEPGNSKPGAPGEKPPFEAAESDPLYGAGASFQGNEASDGTGGEVAPTGGEVVGSGGETAPVYGAPQKGAEPVEQEDPAEEGQRPSSRPNKLRPPLRPAGGAYGLSDDNSPNEQPVEQPAETEGTPVVVENALVQEVPADESPVVTEEAAAPRSLPSTRSPSTLSSIRPNALPGARPFSGGAGSGGAKAEISSTEPSPELQPVRPNSNPGSKAAPGGLGAPVSHLQGTTSGVPGERQMEGMQAPSVALEKLAPAEVQVGKLATFETRVRNVGQISAHEVIVTDHVPRGTRLESTTPQATEAADGTLTWNLGTMQPGDEVAISMQVTPEAEGEIGSVAQVGFAGKATARTISTRPMLKIEHTAPKQVMIGEEVRLGVTITNPGSGAATGVVVEEDVPEGLSHVAGNELEYEIGVLRPGETRELELSLKADKPGVLENTILVRGEGNLTSQHRVQIEVISPQLQVGVSGPKKRFLDRQATYTLTVANPGTAAARDVQLIAYLPKGMKYVSSDSEGQYDAAQHAVLWGLEELPAAKSGNVKLVATPVETGEQRIRIEGKADLGLSVTSEQMVNVEAASELVFSISDLNDPIEVGTDTSYEVRVSNKGTRPATNVLLAAALPGDIKLLSGEGPSRATTRGQQINFEPIARINSGEEIVFRIHAQGVKEGDHLIRVQLSSDEFPNPVTKEESTQVYVDR